LTVLTTAPRRALRVGWLPVPGPCGRDGERVVGWAVTLSRSPSGCASFGGPVPVSPAV